MKNILLTGGSGKLGQAIQNSGLFGALLAPSRETLDITQPGTIAKYFQRHDIKAVVHCAALARIAMCEKDPGKAFQINTVGTGHLVGEILKQKKASKTRFIYISTDGVYPGIKGNYAEHDPAVPYNVYGWTKLGAECAVRMLPNFCIIRTNFFDAEDIKFDKSATDIYTSKVPIAELAKAVKILLESDFVGTVNVGGKKESDYNRYKKFKPELKPCTRRDILKTIPFTIYKDASLDTSLWKKLRKKETPCHCCGCIDA